MGIDGNEKANFLARTAAEERFILEKSTNVIDHDVIYSPVFSRSINVAVKSCHEFEPSTTKDPPCRAAMHVKSVESSNVLPWCGVVVRRGGASSGVVHVT
ncbi:hypothetical protein TNCV_754901 [Trichonephila clavipes]|nr:hypothetical protein TNCV_754901 [Trichonephila clavipes]